MEQQKNEILEFLRIDLNELEDYLQDFFRILFFQNYVNIDSRVFSEEEKEKLLTWLNLDLVEFLKVNKPINKLLNNRDYLTFLCGYYNRLCPF